MREPLEIGTVITVMDGKHPIKYMVLEDTNSGSCMDCDIFDCSLVSCGGCDFEDGKARYFKLTDN